MEGEIAFFHLDGLVLGLWTREHLAADACVPDGGGWGGTTLAKNFRTREAVDTAFAHALGAGATLLKEPVEADWGGYSGYVADPDGHPWELAFNPSWPLDDHGSLVLPG